MTVAILESRDCDVHDLISRAKLIDDMPDAETHLKRCIQKSEQVWLGMYNDEVACVWGLAPFSIISGRAHLWLLTTDIVDQHKFVFVRHSQIAIEQALKCYPVITGCVRVGNDSARRWLRWLGANISVPTDRYSTFEIRSKK